MQNNADGQVVGAVSEDMGIQLGDILPQLFLPGSIPGRKRTTDRVQGIAAFDDPLSPLDRRWLGYQRSRLCHLDLWRHWWLLPDRLDCLWVDNVAGQLEYGARVHIDVLFEDVRIQNHDVLSQQRLFAGVARIDRTPDLIQCIAARHFPFGTALFARFHHGEMQQATQYDD